MYKLELEVTFGNHSANFVLWDQECINIIEKTIVDLRNAMIETIYLIHYMKHTLNLNRIQKDKSKKCRASCPSTIHRKSFSRKGLM